ncbi:hypothetical protein [Cognatilysobacter segetis]|uniref:hypothetical protein n=1 Tax=Cognatilysobacter segetis TaxID=2492394 RepID=UPI00105E08BE|nr:hypothetical protein [Lysobacter segetis]
MAVIAPPTLDDLGVQGCFGLAALLTAQARRIAVSPTRRLTLAYLHPLRQLGVIDAPWPEARWELEPAAEETPIEQMQWRYRWPDYQRDGLLQTLEEFLQSIPMDEYGIACRLRLWQDLVIAEAEQFFESQLLKYHLEGSWAHDLTFAVREHRLELPIAQWRYCCWAATRFAAAQAQRLRGDTSAPGLREEMYAELKRRAQRLVSGDWSNCAFMPFHLRPESAAGRLLTTTLSPLGALYWQCVPSAEVLLIPRQKTSAN